MPINDEKNPLKTSADVSYGADWPISIYERPIYAMSNLFMRGDVDAATRAIFQPDTLSPAEMQTITNRIAGPRPNPLMKTILDVATNPLVIMGLIGGYLLYPAVGKDTLAKVFLNMRQGVPETGLLGRFVGGSFTRMRHLVTHTGESLHAAIADMNKSIADYVMKDQKLRAAAHGNLTSVRAQRQVAMDLQGWAQRGDEGAVNILKMANTPVAPGLQGKFMEGVQSASAKTREYLKHVWKELDEIPGFRENHEKAAKEAGLTLGKYRENYFPHIVEQNKLRQGITKAARIGRPGETWKDPVANSLLRKKGITVPKASELREMEAAGDIVAGYADDVERAIKANIAEFRDKLADEITRNGRSEAGIRKALKTVTARMDLDDVYFDAASNQIKTSAQGFPGRTFDEALDWASEMIRRPGEYSLNLDDALTRYSTQIARAKAVFGVPVGQAEAHGSKIERLIKYFRTTVAPNAKHGETFMPVDGPVDTYVSKQVMPMNLGQMTPKAMARNSAWMEFRKKKMDWLESPMAQKMVPEKPRKWMIDRLGDFSTLDADTIGHGINSYLYMSAMGVNMGPVSKNVFQNFLTFNNMPGMGGAMFQGAKETMDRTMGYLGDVIMKGMPAREAFENHFKEFIEAQGPQAGLIDKLFGAKEIVGMPATGAKRGVEIARDVLMAPFKFSELFVNRMPAFYGARTRVMSWGETAATANKIASNLVDASHFTGGPMGMPGGIIDTWAPWRQFMQFPMRTLDFAMNSTRMGKNPAKLDFGTLSKMTATAAATYTVGKNMLGLDLSPGLMAGAMPFPQYENSPFYPWPLVPPIVQMAGNIVKGVAQGQAKPILDVAPLLVPGGTAAVRLQKTLGRKRADYSNRLEDGRIPVYNDQGGLIGAYTPLQLSLRAMGMMPIDVAAERGASKWLITQRDQIRDYRQKWLEARTANDAVKADRIQRDFQKQYPELGPMQFKKSDINSIEQRRETARLSRIMRGMPKAYKPLFQNIMQEAQISEFTQGAPGTQLPMELEALR